MYKRPTDLIRHLVFNDSQRLISAYQHAPSQINKNQRYQKGCTTVASSTGIIIHSDKDLKSILLDSI